MTTLAVLFWSRFALHVIGATAESDFIDGRWLRSAMLTAATSAGFFFLAWFTVADRSFAAVVAVSIASGIAEGVVGFRRSRSIVSELSRPTRRTRARIRPGPAVRPVRRGA